MRTFALLLVLACPFAVGFCQSSGSSELKHLPAITPAGGWGVLSAQDIVRTAEYPSTVYLKGNVEIKMQVCLPAVKKRSKVCDGYTILHADSAVYHEGTGQIEAQGNVSLSPLQHEGKRK